MNLSPVLHALIIQATTSVAWEECHDIMELETSVATVSMVPHDVDVNMIIIHDVETKCAHFS